MMPFHYGVNVTLAASATGQGTIILGNDSQFDLYAILITSSLDAQAANNTQGQIPNNVLVSIKDDTTGRDFFSTPQPRGNIAGPLLANSFTQGTRIRFPQKEQFVITFQNLVATENIIYFAFAGYKVFTRMPRELT